MKEEKITDDFEDAVDDLQDSDLDNAEALAEAKDISTTFTKSRASIIKPSSFAGILYETDDAIREFNLVKDWFDRGDTIAVIGAPKTYKSFFALYISICLASQQKIFDKFDVPEDVKVLYVQCEVAERHFNKRCRDMYRTFSETIMPPEERNKKSIKDRLSAKLNKNLHIYNCSGDVPTLEDVKYYAVEK